MRVRALKGASRTHTYPFNEEQSPADGKDPTLALPQPLRFAAGCHANPNLLRGAYGGGARGRDDLRENDALYVILDTPR